MFDLNYRLDQFGPNMNQNIFGWIQVKPDPDPTQLAHQVKLFPWTPPHPTWPNQSMNSI